MKSIVVLYHKNCSDGFGAAYAAWKKFKNKAEYIAIEHQSPFPKDSKLKNKEVYLVDFSCSLEQMKKLLKVASSVIVIDHHISAEEATKSATYYSYALNHSGSVLTWKYFHPEKPLPKLLRHIEDIDLWNFKLKNTRELIAAFDIYDFNFKTWDKIAKDIEDAKKRKKYIEVGNFLLRYRDKIIKRLIGNADKVNFEGYSALAVNSPVLQSEIGNALVKKGAKVGIIWSQRNGKRYFSLRSNHGVDVSKLAQKFGGGGHRAASGFSLDIKKSLPWKIIK